MTPKPSNKATERYPNLGILAEDPGLVKLIRDNCGNATSYYRKLNTEIAAGEDRKALALENHAATLVSLVNWVCISSKIKIRHGSGRPAKSTADAHFSAPRWKIIKKGFYQFKTYSKE